jgi:hypothetical protein
MAWQIVAEGSENSLGCKLAWSGLVSYRPAGKPDHFGSELDTLQATIERLPDSGVTHVVERQDSEAVWRIAVADAMNGVGEAE